MSPKSVYSVACSLVALTILAFTPIPGVAQEAEQTLEQQIAMVRSQNESARQAIVAENVALSQAQSDAFWPVYREYRGKAATINDGVKSTILEYAESYDTLTDELAYELAGKVLKLQIERDKLKQQYLKKFAKPLSKLQAARVMQIENKLDALLQALVAAEVPLVPEG